jgi:menaquinone-dependent protoporphyrinogen oxidase
MYDVPVFFSSTEGQIRRIAERLAERVRSRGLTSGAIEVSSPEADETDWRAVRGALVGASLHAGRHQASATRFVTGHRAELNSVPSAFFSVSLAAASKKPGEAVAARAIAADFLNATQWNPGTMVCFAGRLAYTQYGFFTRQLMKWIARRQGGATDTSRDWECTDWDAVDRCADVFASQVLAVPERLAG